MQDMTRKTKSPKGKVVIVSVSLSPEAAAKLAKYCERHQRPRSWVVEKALQAYLTKLEKGGGK
jgi:predicted transcriptional regulator